MNQETWHSLVPNYDIYDTQINQFSEIASPSFWCAQKRLQQSLTAFTTSNASKICLINAPDNALYRRLIHSQLQTLTDKPILGTESNDIKEILGYYSVSDSGELCTYRPGLLANAHNGLIIISATLLLKNGDNWPLIKAALMQNELSPLNVTAKNVLSTPIVETTHAQVVVVGDRNQLADLDFIEPDLLTGFGMFGELELELALNSQSIQQYLSFIKWLEQEYALPSISPNGIHSLMNASARFTEDQNYMSLDVLWNRALLIEASTNMAEQKQIDANDIELALNHRYQRENYLPERALSDILDGQVIIETDGERVGQVNGLTVVDIPGHPLAYGEPARISCVIHFGDGDIADVERKAELGGNLHAKGMMIMQAFVSSALNLDEPLPYSASVVFEQSYCEVDGDSASLAELCSFVSALSEYPINQQIAVTGAVDQFGRVQAVGGLNEKIEGFYRVCQHQGLTGHQGVILPKSNLKHLALNNDVIHSIKNGDFHIWSVSNVDEAIPLIMGKPFRGEDNSSVISKIAERIENYEKHEHPPTIVERIKNWFVKH